MNWLLTIVIIVVVMTVVMTIMLSLNQARERRRRQMAVMMGSSGGAGSGVDKDKQLAKHRADIARKLKEASAEDENKKNKVSLKALMQQAGIDAPVSKFWMMSAGFAVFAGLFFNFGTDWPKIAVVFATFAAFIGVPRFFLNWKAGRRQHEFLMEFPDALDASVRLLQAGMPITEAIAMASREFTGVLREEMARIYDNQKIGVPLGEAAAETARRVPLAEVHMFATALQIQSETGSSLSEVLSNLSTIIRARYRLKRKVKALSSEAKASAMIIGSLPILVTLGLNLANPEYIELLYTTSKGKFLATCAVGWMSIGIMGMRQMINFKV